MSEELEEGQFVCHNIDGALGRIKKVYGPGEKIDEKGRVIADRVVVVEVDGSDEEYLLPGGSKRHRFTVLPESAEAFRDELRTIVDDQIRTLCAKGFGHGLSEHESMLIIGCVIRERLRNASSNS